MLKGTVSHWVIHDSGCVIYSLNCKVVIDLFVPHATNIIQGSSPIAANHRTFFTNTLTYF